MKVSPLLSIPVPAPRKCRSILNKQSYEIEQNTKQLPRCIPYCTLDDNIIWLDLLANERNLTFTDHMVTSGRLNIFNTAVDCFDFFDLFSRRLNLSSSQAIYSIIISGVYAIDRKVISQLLLYGFVNHIYLIVHESCFGNLPDLFILNQRLNVVYNDDPDIVMHWLCNDYLNFEIFIQHNKELHTATREMSFRQTYKRNQVKEKKFNGMVNNMSSNSNRIGRSNFGLPPVKNTCSSMGTRSSSYQQIKLMELPVPFSSKDPNDAFALKELEQIRENLSILDQVVDAFRRDGLTHDNRWYKQLEDQALQLMIRCDKLTDVTSELKVMRRQMVHNIQKMLNKLDLNASIYVNVD